MQTKYLRLLAALLVSWSASASSAWEVVAFDQGRRIALDRAGVMPGGPGLRNAPVRVMLAPDEAAHEGYAVLETVNGYDCAGGRFNIRARRYFDAGGRPVREDVVADQRWIEVTPHSVAERLWRAVCEGVHERPHPRDGAVQPPPAAARAVEAEHGDGTDAAEGWAYAGKRGSQQWGRLDRAWTLCASGRRQSPIDLRDGVAVALEPLWFDYRSGHVRLREAQHTVQVSLREPMGVRIRGRYYTLTHLQFHRPSPERIGGRAFDMAVHLHHRDDKGRLAVVAIMLDSGPHHGHGLIERLWRELPRATSRWHEPPLTIDLASLIPPDGAHFLYNGSLTTPPCTEGVTWAVMKTPIRISTAQLERFAARYPRNSRPIQPRHDRRIVESRAGTP